MDIYWDARVPEIKGVFICWKGSWRVKAALRVCGSGLRPVAQSADKVCGFFYVRYFEFQCIKYLALIQPAQVLGRKIPKVQIVFH